MGELEVGRMGKWKSGGFRVPVYNLFLVQMSYSLESLLSLRKYVQAVSEGDC